jgi:hypothetical protein
VIKRVLDGFEGKLTNAKWAALGKCSADTALYDINDLLARGVLRRPEGGGRSTGYKLCIKQGSSPSNTGASSYQLKSRRRAGNRLGAAVRRYGDKGLIRIRPKSTPNEMRSLRTFRLFRLNGTISANPLASNRGSQPEGNHP